MDAPPFNGLAEHNGLNPVYYSVAHLYSMQNMRKISSKCK